MSTHPAQVLCQTPHRKALRDVGVPGWGRVGGGAEQVSLGKALNVLRESHLGTSECLLSEKFHLKQGTRGVRYPAI